MTNEQDLAKAQSKSKVHSYFYRISAGTEAAARLPGIAQDKSGESNRKWTYTSKMQYLHTTKEVRGSAFHRLSSFALV